MKFSITSKLPLPELKFLILIQFPRKNCLYRSQIIWYIDSPEPLWKNHSCCQRLCEL